MAVFAVLAAKPSSELKQDRKLYDAIAYCPIAIITKDSPLFILSSDYLQTLLFRNYSTDSPLFKLSSDSFEILFKFSSDSLNALFRLYSSYFLHT